MNNFFSIWFNVTSYPAYIIHILRYCQWHVHHILESWDKICEDFVFLSEMTDTPWRCSSTGSHAGTISTKKVQFWHRREGRKVCCGFPLTFACFHEGLWGQILDPTVGSHSWPQGRLGTFTHPQSSQLGVVVCRWGEKLEREKHLLKNPTLVSTSLESAVGWIIPNALECDCTWR